MPNQLYNITIATTLTANSTVTVSPVVSIPDPGFSLIRFRAYIYRTAAGLITKDTAAQEEVLVTFKDADASRVYMREAMPIWALENPELAQTMWLGQYWSYRHTLEFTFTRTNTIVVHASDIYYVKLVMQGYLQKHVNHPAAQGMNIEGNN